VNKPLPLRGGFFYLFPALFFITLLTAFCRTDPNLTETPLPVEAPEPRFPQPAGTGGIVDEIRFYTENAIPSSLLNVLDIINSRDLSSTDFGRMMTAINVTLLKTLYPSVQKQLPLQDPPATHNYSRILREAERDIYTPPLPSSTDFLEHVLPFLAYYTGGMAVPAEQYRSTLPNLEKAERLNNESVLAKYFIGIVYERTGRLEDAYAKFSLTWELFPECYPAALALVRVMEAQGRKQEAMRFLSDLTLRYPDNIEVKRQLALAYYLSGSWPRADAAVTEVLKEDSLDGDFILMKAHILVEQRQMLQAQTHLDAYAGINPINRLYLFLRARVQAEAFRNRDAALNYLRTILRNPSVTGGGVSDDEVALYAARLLIESSRPEDLVEGRDLLKKLLAVPAPEVLILVLEDLILREEWEDAMIYLPRLLALRRSSEDLLTAYTVESGRGNYTAALSYARELYERDRSNQEGVITYISALIDAGRRDEAAGMIDARFNDMTDGTQKSRYYYLRSRIRNNEELAVDDLRSSLYEDARNLNALIAMFEIYHHRRDERRALYYLKQALALAPGNPRLMRYGAEYALL
jgi:tetratricopeptide (TPR) repeat protein